MRTRIFTSSIAIAAMACAMVGCSHPAQPMAPPISQNMMNQGGGDTYQWQDVPQGQQVPITRAVFDQGGYQLYAQSGETIVVPFANQNMYVMKFGQTSGGMYFVNDGSAPTLYIPPGGALENAAAQGARWYPFSQNFAYSRPVYVGIAPSWADYTGMGWYPGMSYYGGYWGYNPWHPGLGYAVMTGLVIHMLGGGSYYGWGAYHSYYVGHSYGRVGWSNHRSYNYTSVGRRPSSGFGSRSVSRGTGSFNKGSSSFGTQRRSSFGSGQPGFSGSQRSSGSFGGSRPRSSFGGGGSFGGSRPSGGSFGGGRSGGSFGRRR